MLTSHRHKFLPVLLFLTSHLVNLGSTPIVAEDAGDLLIEPKSLAESLGEFHIIEFRTKESYDRGHLAGSRRADPTVWKDLSLSRDGLKRADDWTRELQSLGLDNTKPTIVVGDSITTTARGWWLLSYLGLKDVRLLLLFGCDFNLSMQHIG